MPIRVLHIIGRMHVGGAETFIMNVYRNIDRQKVQFDFVVHTNEKCFYDDEIEKLGGKIYRIPRFSKHPIKSMIELKKVIKNKSYCYDIIHRHTDSSIVFTDLIIAKLMKVKKIIVHSHNTQTANQLIHKLFRPFMRIANIKYACSQEAGEWLFGKKAKFEIINNGIDVEKYKFDENIRKEIRNELNIKDDEIVVGHVGRFCEVKNHKFIIDIFNEFQKNIKSKLILTGSGNLLEEIKEKVRQNKLEDKVIFLGIRNDVHKVMQSMDIFLFPSLYEGLPLTLIEAQAAGLNIIASNNISDMCNITNTIQFMSLENSAEIWSNEMKKILEKPCRNNNFNLIYEAKFDCKQTAKKLEDIYIK